MHIFSEIVDSATVRDNQYNLTPAAYVAAIVEEDTTTFEEIDEELKKQYENLQAL